MMAIQSSMIWWFVWIELSVGKRVLSNIKIQEEKKKRIITNTFARLWITEGEIKNLEIDPN